jgi:hypothetical protein
MYAGINQRAREFYEFGPFRIDPDKVLTWTFDEVNDKTLPFI